ncbi:Teichoic acids export ATP-binding protein TagH [Novipirellula galeiformis]|uniref:Teichoic acids export ATP-binding protein TagH n=1 Tax=Novipirellula galeiformis TaxID=2528004 RepID=A0A5C6BXS5_9BACT|nr:ABC transporter ATP-binding protein [Novipirellula galeiformis]TWU17103.1 Teichoic acids export ATP-binding protein TagH [Novipirellula galeiformis]
MTVAIRFRDVSKQYRLGEIGTGTLANDLHRIWARLRGKPDPFAMVGAASDEKPRSKHDYVLALNDIDLDIEKGEIFGIIGHNGAGKSTLLKLLSRVTAPSTGTIKARGRIASLLEVGTGFHPELTGRENIYINGAILGMSRREIDQQLDNIVDFSGCEKYLDTPVKRYSSGMMVRLGFAVAAHLQCEILIVDEVLAVGDAAFQKKCIGKINEVTSGGRTTLLVSHNMALMRQLATRCALLKQGKIVHTGPPSEVIAKYLRGHQGEVPGFSSLANHPNRLSGMAPLITAVTLSNDEGETSSQYLQNEAITIKVDYDGTALPEPLSGAGFIIESLSGVRVGGFNSYMAAPPPHRIEPRGRATFRLHSPTLTPGTYQVTVSLGSHQSRLVDKVESAIQFTVAPDDLYETGYLLTPEDGVVAFRCDFHSLKS